MTDEERLRHALERCRAWNIRNGNWSQEMEELVDAALADPDAGAEDKRTMPYANGFNVIERR
jgi:hypothetical protein